MILLFPSMFILGFYVDIPYKNLVDPHMARGLLDPPAQLGLIIHYAPSPSLYGLPFVPSPSIFVTSDFRTASGRTPDSKSTL